jgi:hypothetical protein
MHWMQRFGPLSLILACLVVLVLISACGNSALHLPTSNTVESSLRSVDYLVTDPAPDAVLTFYLKPLDSN